MSAQYPGAAGTDANLFVAVNNLSTSLTDNPLSSGATTVNVASTTGFPTAGYITIEAEAISYTGTTGTSFTGCTRGADGTTAASHVTATSVFHDVVAAHHNVLKDEIKAIETDLVASYTGGSTTIATTFAKYLKLIGGALTGALAMGSNKITGLANGSASGDALNWGQAFTSGQITFSPTTTGIKGTTTNDDRAAGNVGEYVSSTVGTTTIATTNTGQDITSISLTAGDWNVTGGVRFTQNGATWTQQLVYVANGVSGNSFTGSVPGLTTNLCGNASSATTPTDLTMFVPSQRISLASPAIIYLKVRALFSAGSPQAEGSIEARRA